MKKVFLVLAVVMLLTAAATMTMAATLAEWNFDLSSYSVTPGEIYPYCRYAAIDGTLQSTATTLVRKEADTLFPTYNMTTTWPALNVTNWQQSTGYTGQALHWWSNTGETHYVYTGELSPAGADENSNLTNWFNATRKQLTISCKVKFDWLRALSNTSNQNMNQFFTLSIGQSGDFSQILFNVNASVVTWRYKAGGTAGGLAPGGTGCPIAGRSDSLTNYMAYNTYGNNPANNNGICIVGTPDQLLPNTIEGLIATAGLTVGRFDTSYNTCMQRFAERGSIDTATPAVAKDPDAVLITSYGPDGVANTADDWYKYTMTVDFSSGTVAHYKVYIGNKLQASIDQNLPSGLAPGNFWTIRNIQLGAYAAFSGAIDDLKITDTIDPPTVTPPAGAVTGTVDLQGWSGAKLGQAVAVTITDASSNSETLNTTLDSNGGYSVTTTLRGTCYVSAKCSHWLSDGKEAVVDANGAAAIDFSMINGDCNNDNGVDEGDFGLLSSAWYSSDGDPNFDSRADLNGDGGVDEGDFGLLSAAWYQSGI